LGLAILGPYYSVWDVTRADVALANKLDLICSMHVGGGTPMTAGGFERLAVEIGEIERLDRHGIFRLPKNLLESDLTALASPGPPC